MTRQHIFDGHFSGAPTDGDKHYNRVMNQSWWRDTAQACYQVVPTNGKFEGMDFEVLTAPGVGTVWTITLHNLITLLVMLN